MVYIPTRYYAEEEEKLPLRVLYVDGVGEMSVFAAFMWKIC